MEDEIIQEFLAESWENLAQLDIEIVELEKDPRNGDLLASIFRTIHTIKGTCGFIGLSELGSVAHSAENVLGLMRDGTLEVTQDAISVVLEAIDQIKNLLDGIEATGEEPAVDNRALIARLDALVATVQSAPDIGQDSSASEEPGAELSGAGQAAADAQTTALPAGEAEDANTTTPSQPSGESSAEDLAGSAAAQAADSADGALETALASDEDSVRQNGNGSDTGKKSVADLSIRVNVDVLDSLMNLVGELVLTRNQLLQLSRGDDESKYAAPISHLNRVTTDLQEGVMKTRMQPIGNAWSKLPRLVRDLRQVTGKQMELEMSGAETELDRTVLDAIKDPLTHMVRNSADHGIESPEVRRSKGKPETGKIKLTAYHEGGHVIICVEDDGAGIDLERVRAKIVANGLATESDAEKLSAHELLQHVFNPGLSTAEKVSSVSGRGVGMDVVKTQIEQIGGTVDLSSTPGAGSTVRIRIPLTLAIISALVVESGGESIAIPQLGVVELVRLAAEDKNKIETIHDNEVFRLRDRLLPLVHLDQVLGLNQSESDDEKDINIVVVQVGEEQFGLIVSEVFDTEEIVVKPVGNLLKDIDIYQGTTILGDGRVIMILDVSGIAGQFGGNAASLSEQTWTSESDLETGDVTSLLLFNAGGETTMAVPLSLVARLEEVSRDAIEQTSDKLVVQYRGDLLPLLPANGQSTGTLDPQPIIVFTEGNNSMGLMVEEILDITEQQLVIRMSSKQPGLLGAAIIDGKATDVIDTQYYIMQANPDWFAKGDDGRSRHVLVVDGSMFFRQLVTTTLQSEGYEVTTAESAIDAVERIEHGEQFDVIISDLDLPMMNGLEFAEWLRERPDTEDVLLLALTNISASSQEETALQAGFDQFLIKLDVDQLLSSVEQPQRRPAAACL